LIPKNVEFFQDKVHKFPAVTAKQVELQREAAALAKEKSRAVTKAAIEADAPANVTEPAQEVEILTDAVSTSLGPPVSPSTNSAEVASKLNKSVAKHDNKVESFAKENNKDAGKKIEGTGLIQVPYFIYLGGFLVVAIIFWHLAKTALQAAGAAYPPAAIPASIAVGGMNVAQSTLAKGFQQIVSGGESFKNWIENEIPDDALKQKIISAFTANHQTAQDSDVQAVVKALK